MSIFEIKKLESIFYKRYMELAFSYRCLERNFEAVGLDALELTWSGYLKLVECTPLSENHCGFDLLIADPSPFGKFISIPKDKAEKILVLGLP